MMQVDRVVGQEPGSGIPAQGAPVGYPPREASPRHEPVDSLAIIEMANHPSSTWQQRGAAFREARRVVLEYAGIDIDDFHQVRNLWPNNWLNRVKAGVAQDDVAEYRCDLVGRALECVAWHRYRSSSNPNDKSLQMLLRAEVLMPGDLRITLRLAQLALEVTGDHLSARLSHEKREEIVLSHKEKARRAISDTLRFEFGITDDMVKKVGGVATHVREGYAENEPTRDIVFELLYDYAALSYQVAMSPVEAFFIRDGRNKRPQFFTVSLGYVGTLLDILGCSRKPWEAWNQIGVVLDRAGPDSQPFGDRTGQMAHVLHLWGAVLWDWSDMGFEGVGDWYDAARELMGLAERMQSC